ncbi:class I SAM-dependent methyltransferase [Bradyrhizobium sp. HKCCYLS20291]|uniref:class I SAM-dependent methyltransferase n=1 Tax=Bradyrhizobium sp. HKCCYLS20291 TaxID=3420766 RepID=UPI003EBA6268
MSVKYKITRLASQICPPVMLPLLRKAYRASIGRSVVFNPGQQNLDVYWDPVMEQVLETWGEGNVWSEIQLALAGRQGRVLDIACGTGKTMEVLSGEPSLELWGCDISDRLIDRAIERGIHPERVHVGDATKLPYPDGFFDFSFSIGSIEHFTEDGIAAMLAECRRVTRVMAFHTHPVSRRGDNEGWITTAQSYFNNSVDWWLPKYQAQFQHVRVLNSLWSDERSEGRWFVCS